MLCCVSECVLGVSRVFSGKSVSGLRLVDTGSDDLGGRVRKFAFYFFIFLSCLFTESHHFVEINRVFVFFEIVSISFFSCPIVSVGSFPWRLGADRISPRIRVCGTGPNQR